MNPFLLLLPDLALIALGFVLSRKLDWGPDLWPGLERLVYYVLFPSLLIQSLLRNPVDWAAAGPMALAVVTIVLGTMALAALARPALRPTPLRFASALQCAFRFNTYLLLAVAQRVGGPQALATAAIIIATAVPLCNVLAVTALTGRNTRALVREWSRNPLLIATVLGIIGSAVGIRLPEPVDAFLGRTAGAALALGLMTVGAGIRLQAVRGDVGYVGWITAVKLGIAPLIALGAAHLLGLPPLETTTLLIFAALPTAPAAFVLASRMGGDGPYVAVCVTVSTLVAMVTLPLWLLLAA